MTWILAVLSWFLSPISLLLWFVALVLRVCLAAVPVWLLWTVAGFGQHLSPFLPQQFASPGLYDIIGIIVAFCCVRAVVMPVMQSPTINRKDS